jgi:hypothetical protein
VTVKPFCCPTSHYREGCWRLDDLWLEVSSWRMRVEWWSGWCGGERESVWCWADIAVDSVNTKVCRKKNKQFGISKAAMITKNEVISVNELNYKAPEKSHNTEELVGYHVHLCHLQPFLQGSFQSYCWPIWNSDTHNSLYDPHRGMFNNFPHTFY